MTSVTTPSVPCCAELVKSEVSSSSARVLSVLQSVIVAVGSPNAYTAKLVLSVSAKPHVGECAPPVDFPSTVSVLGILDWTGSE